ncbi:MAG: protein NO VEIN domain-containing protein [Microcystis sp.]|uniref:protein NO VEIN domain-containing protein n=1 Tax=Microcystis sp. TaxID=1127 RepID=UPI00391D89A2
MSIVFDLERTNQLNLLPDKDLVDLCHPIEPYQVTKNHDFLCKDSKGKNIYSEVKTISYNNPIIRLKTSQWESLCSENRKDNYELVIVIHKGDTLIEIIRVSSVWATLKNILSKLNHQSISQANYQGTVEVILGLQKNQDGNANEILINWQRLFKSIQHSHVNIYPQGIPNVTKGS